MITFNQLWNNHPTIKGNDNPCSTNGKPNFPNQCSIRLGVCLQNSGIDTTRIPGIRHCWQHDKTAGHVLSAEEFANGLKKHSPFIPGIQNFQEIKPNEFSDLLAGNKGIIFFKDYWRRKINGKMESFRNRSGDHIDLWNGHRITDWRSWARIHLRIGNFGLHSILTTGLTTKIQKLSGFGGFYEKNHYIPHFWHNWSYSRNNLLSTIVQRFVYILKGIGAWTRCRSRAFRSFGFCTVAHILCR